MLSLTIWLPSDAVASALITISFIDRVTKAGDDTKETVHKLFSGSIAEGKAYDRAIPCIAV